jgi:hypothetical protein
MGRFEIAKGIVPQRRKSAPIDLDDEVSFLIVAHKKAVENSQSITTLRKAEDTFKDGCRRMRAAGAISSEAWNIISQLYSFGPSKIPKVKSRVPAELDGIDEPSEGAMSRYQADDEDSGGGGCGSSGRGGCGS